MKRWLMIFVFAAGVALGLWLGRGHPADPVVLAGADSTLAAAKPQQAHRDTLTRVIRRIVADTEALQAAQREADRLHAVADSARQRLTTATDSIPLLLTALAAETQRADRLDAALTDQVQRFGKLVAADSTYRDAAEARIGRLESTLGTVTAELRKARRSGPCALGTVSAGVTLAGTGALVLGGSCRVLPLLRTIF